jgi:hypothetical protein
VVTSRCGTMVECTNLINYSVEKHEPKSAKVAISMKLGQIAKMQSVAR